MILDRIKCLILSNFTCALPRVLIEFFSGDYEVLLLAARVTKRSEVIKLILQTTSSHYVAPL